MPQHFQVLRCYKCLVFQGIVLIFCDIIYVLVHQIRKANKFECKLCGEKQSIKRHYGLGTGQDCRVHVQKLNAIRGEIDQLNTSHDDVDFNEPENDRNCKVSLDDTQLKKQSKWLEYVENTKKSIDEPSNEIMFLGNAEVVLEVPKKRRTYYRNKGKKLIGKNSCADNISPSHESNLIDEQKSLEFQSIPSSITRSQNVSKKESISSTPEVKNISRKYVPPIPNKKSKWADYFDITKQSNEGKHPEDNYKRAYSFFEKYKINECEGGMEERKIHNTFSSNNNDIAYFTCENEKVEIICQKRTRENRQTIFVPPVINKQSKWAQYANETQENVEHDNESQENVEHENESSDQLYGPSKDYPKTEPQKLFSLCDDGDLDDVLDF